MKNLLTSILLVISGSILFTSCNQGISLTKRHYRNGYHVEYASKRPTIKPKENNSPSIVTSAIPSEEPAEDVMNNNNNINHGFRNEQKEISSNEKNAPAKIQKPVGQKNVFEKAISTAFNDGGKKNAAKILIKDKFKAVNSLKNSDEDARSFFWLVIMIILILWLIALLTGGWGLGGVIHLLLLIALILFILWLLRLI